MCLIPFFHFFSFWLFILESICCVGRKKRENIKEAKLDVCIWYHMSLFRRRRWCYGMIYWRCYSSHKCTIVRIQQWNISFRIKRTHHLYFNHPTPPSPLKEKEEENERWWRGASYFFSCEQLLSWYMLLRGRVLCAVRHTVALAAKRPRWVLLVGALFFLSLSLNSVLCVYHCLPCACLYARLMPPY